MVGDSVVKKERNYNWRETYDLRPSWRPAYPMQGLILRHYDPKYGEEVSARVTEKEGIYEVSTNRSIRRFASLRDMPLYMQKAIAILSISEPEYHLKGVGRRLHGGRFWLYGTARKTMKGETNDKT